MKKGNNINSQTTQAFQLGGTVQLPGFTGMQITPSTAPTTGYRPYVEPVQAASSQFVPQFTGVQYTTATGTTNIPTFAETLSRNPGQYDEFRTYVNDAGQTLRIPFKNGQPIYPIPYGYKYQAEETTTSTDTSTVPTTVVRPDDDGGGDGSDSGVDVSGAVQGPAGGPTGVAGLTSAFGGLGSYLSGQPAQAQPYGGTTLSGLTNSGTITDFSNNISGVQDALGVYASGPINLGVVGNLVMGNPFGALASVSGIGPSSEAFGQPAPAGFGAFSTSQLEDYVSGKLNPADAALVGIAMDKNQAQARAEVQRAIGTPITGIMGYKKGDISPITGTPVNFKGRVVNYKGSSTGVDAGFETFGGWMEAMKASSETGYYGGPLSKAEVANLSEKAKKGYAAKARALGYNEQGEGPPGSGGPAAEAGITGGFGPTGRQSDTGRQDYSGGISQDTPDAPSVGVGETGPDTGMGTAGDDGEEGGGYGSDGGVGGGMGVICLTEDMKVKLNGVVDFVTKIQVGDIIDNTIVTEVLHKHMREGYYKVNGELKITNDHPVLANGSWKRTEDLVLGDYINNVEVTSLEYIEQVTPTVYIGTAEDRYDVYTEGEVYTVHGQYKNALKKAA